MTNLEKIFVALMFMIFINIWGHSQVSAQTEISVPIPEGWIGTIGSNTQQAVVVKSFATMGIRRVFITQVSTSGAFEVQGNDVSIILKIELMDGNVLDLPGTLTWRVASGNSILAFGIIPAAGGTFINIEGASGASYDAPVATPGTIYYRVIATDSNGPVSITSNEVSVTVNADPVISSGPNSSEVCVGADAILTVTANGGVGDLIYQWETSTTSNGTYSPIQGATGATYDAPTTTAGVTFYHVKIKLDETGCEVVSYSAVVLVNWPQQYQTKADLDYASPRTWTDKSNWEQYNGSAWVDAVTYPGEITNSCSSPLVTIQDSHLMEISDADISIPNLEIKSTGKLSLKSTGKITVNGSYTAVSGAEIKILTNNQ